MLRTAVKTIVRQIPPINRLIKQRDDLLGEGVELKAGLACSPADAFVVKANLGLVVVHGGLDGQRWPS
jgi:hypothetical protein